MPRKPQPASTPPSAGLKHSGPLTLSPTAQALVDQIAEDWTLTAPAAALLRLIGEHLTRSEECDQVLAREGLTVNDQKGSHKAHPLALLSRDHKNAASNALQKLLSNLDQG
jgi:hypothetical protein